MTRRERPKGTKVGKLGITIQRGEQGKTSTWRTSTCESRLRCEFPLSCWLNLSLPFTHPLLFSFFYPSFLLSIAPVSSTHLFHLSYPLTISAHSLPWMSLFYWLNQAWDKWKTSQHQKGETRLKQIESKTQDSKWNQPWARWLNSLWMSQPPSKWATCPI